MKDGTFSKDNMHPEGFTFDRNGVDFPVYCDGCKRFLTTFKMNDFCVIDMDVECTNCHKKGEFRNMRADPPIKMNLAEFTQRFVEELKRRGLEPS